MHLCCVTFYFLVIFEDNVGMQKQAVGRHETSIYFSHVFFFFSLSPNKRVDSTSFKRKLI